MIEVMVVYHEVDSSSLGSILKKGLRRASHGEKSDESAVAKADTYLDGCRPSELEQVGVARSENLYGYVVHDNKIINITDGRAVDIATFVNSTNQVVLRLHIAPERCFVSDLDAYDTLKAAIENKSDDGALQRLSKKYWNSIIPLAEFSVGAIQRPEVMITYDIAPNHIELLPRNE